MQSLSHTHSFPVEPWILYLFSLLRSPTFMISYFGWNFYTKDKFSKKNIKLSLWSGKLLRSHLFKTLSFHPALSQRTLVIGVHFRNETGFVISIKFVKRWKITHTHKSLRNWRLLKSLFNASMSRLMRNFSFGEIYLEPLTFKINLHFVIRDFLFSVLYTAPNYSFYASTRWLWACLHSISKDGSYLKSSALMVQDLQP